MGTEKQDLIGAFREVSKEKGISIDVLFGAIEAALAAAYKKNFNAAQNVRVALNHDTGEYHVYAIKTVVDEAQNDVTEISLDKARRLNSAYEIGDTIEEEVTPGNFGRLAAQAARQVVVQRIRETERLNVFDEYSKRVNDILTATVQCVEGKNVIIDLGNAEGLLAPAEQIPTERYLLNERMKLYIVEVKNNNKGPQVLFSRTHPGLLKRLFELEVPEISDGVVEIKSVAREPGMRSKIAVYSKEEDIDPVGSCVGQRGMRVQSIVDELHGEKIDIVKWNPDPVKYIANSLSPAKVVSVAVKEDEKISRVIVPDHQLSLAIGKEGQNARLAAKLTGWKIDIKSESQAAQGDLDDDGMTAVSVTGEKSFSVD